MAGPAAAAAVETREMKDATVRFLKNRFRRYYSSARLAPPPEIERREFAFVDFEAKLGMIRPVGFASVDGLRAWLKERAPAHSYYSTAYYQDPRVEHREKVWLGGDLIFDLDADHVRGSIEAAKRGGYGEMLRVVKDEFFRLLNFLTVDLGYPEKEILLVFSGGRGYHAHVRDPRVRRLGSRERREIVDYITARGLLGSMYLREIGVEPGSEGARQSRWRGKGVKAKELVDEPGWAHRLRAGHVEFVRVLAKMGADEAKMYVFDVLKPEGLSASRKADVRKVESLLETLRAGRRVDELASTGHLDILKDSEREVYLWLLIAYKSLSLEGETDEPVTSDTKRLIRLPGSLHGKSGLTCMVLEFADLAEFDPLVEAVPAAFRDDPVKVEVVKEMRSKLRGQDFALKSGASELPEFAAVFFALRGAVQIKA